MVSISNHRPSKLDHFLEVEASLTAVPRRSDAAVDVTLGVRLTNTLPAGQPAYVAGAPVDGAAGWYYGFLSLHLPDGATGVAVAELGDLYATPPPGEQQSILFGREVDGIVVNGWDGVNRHLAISVGVRPGETVVRTVQFSLPAGVARAVRVVPSARWPEITWTAPAGVTDRAATTIALGS